MAQLRTPPRANLSVLLGSVVAGIAGLGMVRWLLIRPKRRPTADELMRMDQASFENFIRSSGLKTASDLEAETDAAD